MRKFLVNAAVAAVLGLTGLAGAASTASAESFVFEFGSPRGVDVQYRDYDRYGDERDWRRDRYRPGFGERRGRCAPWIAVEKARDRGLRRAYVADVSRRRVVVEGRRRGSNQTIVFANVRGCPFIGRW
ncbi:hypothetical protein PYH37_004775 [Sinorhizobium numidicum]|uniref:Antifreeze protein n=1 Tax=Sinorhizobium numidicum TaxID=680248 RepID=A0ABY8CZ19_9HYPH|nr:hypothetical protein [Sinorhizobium numidicum]WEX76466.1 hypothetical protein PYH37_004775 [Sinorhizobium numidicum]WEX83127.1 hypothetical protein PYH38_005487 [Sinorhizobium numidicum]